MSAVRTVSTRFVATSMAIILVGLGTPWATSAPPLSGTVLGGSDRLPLAGATVHLSDVSDGRLVSSPVTGKNGAFAVDDLAPATYEVAVEHAGGLYIVGSPVRVVPGQPLVLHLAIRETAKASALQRARPGTGGLLSSPLAATLFVAGSAIAVGAVVESATSDDEDPPASEFLNR